MQLGKARVTLFAGCLLVAALYVIQRGFNTHGATAQTPTFSIRQLPLVTNDLVYHAASNTFFASLPSAAGSRGNSIAAINPLTGDIVATTFIGSEPNKLSLSDNGQYLYVTLDGAAAVRRYEVATRAAGLECRPANNPDREPLYAEALAVVPGRPESLLISRTESLGSNGATLALYENYTARPTIFSSNNHGTELVFTENPAIFFAFEKGGSGTTSQSLYKMALDSNGVTRTQTIDDVAFDKADVKYARGLLYSSHGVVFSAETGRRVGNFGEQGYYVLVAPDANLNRVFFLTGNGAIRTLRAFDATSYAQLGAMDVPAVAGSPSNLLRWGVNGLAFRTSGGQVFFVQTLLVSPTGPISTPTPTPSPTPTPTPPANAIRTINLMAKDLAYDAARRTIYASVPGLAGRNGNSLTPIDPFTGIVGASIFIGSEPGRLALSDDGQLLYVGLDGAGSVRRFDLATRTPGQQFYLGNTDSYGAPYAYDVEVLPGNPASFAVARYGANTAPGPHSMAVFLNSAQGTKVLRPLLGGAFLAFGATARQLYATGEYALADALRQFELSDSDVTQVNFTPAVSGGDIKFAQGSIYSPGGTVFDPVARTLKGRFKFDGLGLNVLPEVAKGRIYFLTATSSTRTLRVFDINTFLPLGTISFSGSGTLGTGSLIRWGTNGLAFRNGTNQITLIQTPLVSDEPIQPLPTPTPLPVPTPAPESLLVREVALAANDLAYEAGSGVLYASVAADASSRAGTITPINPLTGALGNSVLIGGDPGRLALSSNGQYLYVALKFPTGGVRRFDTRTQTVGLQFALGNNSSGQSQVAGDLEVVPGNPNALAVYYSDAVLAIYDDGKQRGVNTVNLTSITRIEFGATPDTLYCTSSANDLFRMSVNEQGVTLLRDRTVRGLFFGAPLDIKFDSGRLYAPSRQVIDAEAQQLLGTFPAFISSANAVMDPDSATGYAFFLGALNTQDENNVTLYIYDQRTFLAVASYRIPGVLGVPLNLIRWGANGLAFSTSRNQVFLLQVPLPAVPGSALPSAPVNVSAASYDGRVLARDSIVTAFGTNLAATTETATTLPLPTTLAGARVLYYDQTGIARPAQLFFASPTQINFLMPMVLGLPALTFIGPNGSVFTSYVPVDSVAPGLFTANATGQGAAAGVALRVRADGAQSFEPLVRFDAAQNRFVTVPIELGPESDQVFLVLFGTGVRNRRALDGVTAKVGGLDAPVLFAGPQGSLLGLDQINLRLPRALAGRGEVEVALVVEGRAANLVRVAVK
jgi:uncharacterized protein (TIGR03437 family)